ncbi:MAG: hypothetical protein KGO81_06330 [Bacteroidota bacterium]|nr:hypothetical protein [Bacteroidota bacterium]
MQPRKKQIKKIALISLSTFLVLVLTLAIHIYMVTRPKVDASTIVMARADFHQNMQAADAEKVTAWLYAQQGVTHVLCNPATRIAVFTFYPVKADANAIIRKMGTELNYNVSRNMPTQEEMQGGCPVKPNSYTARVYGYFKNIFKS